MKNVTNFRLSVVVDDNDDDMHCYASLEDTLDEEVLSTEAFDSYLLEFVALQTDPKTAETIEALRVLLYRDDGTEALSTDNVRGALEALAKGVTRDPTSHGSLLHTINEIIALAFSLGRKYPVKK